MSVLQRVARYHILGTMFIGASQVRSSHATWAVSAVVKCTPHSEEVYSNGVLVDLLVRVGRVSVRDVAGEDLLAAGHSLECVEG